MAMMIDNYHNLWSINLIHDFHYTIDRGLHN